MGLTLGLVAAPCIGPFVLGLLTWVASLGSPWLGFLIFFTLSLGLGLPLFILAIFSGSLEKLPRSGEWMLWVRKLMGWVLVGMAAYFIRPLLPEAAGVLLLAAVALAAAIHLGWLDRTTVGFRSFQWIKTVAALAGVILATFLAGSWALRGPGVAWQPYSDQLLAQALKEQEPVIIDFYATWCAPCRELDDIDLPFIPMSSNWRTRISSWSRETAPRKETPCTPVCLAVRDQGSAHAGLSGWAGARAPEPASGRLLAAGAGAVPHGRRPKIRLSERGMAC